MKAPWGGGMFLFTSLLSVPTRLSASKEPREAQRQLCTFPLTHCHPEECLPAGGALDRVG